jgi:hypothetical protein
VADPVDTVLVDEVVTSVESDGKLQYQRVVPWTKNAARRIAKGTFDERRFCEAIQTYLVPEALRSSGIDPHDTDLETREALVDKLCGGIVTEARVLARTPKLISSWESAPAREYRAQVGIER